MAVDVHGLVQYAHDIDDAVGSDPGVDDMHPIPITDLVLDGLGEDICCSAGVSTLRHVRACPMRAHQAGSASRLNRRCSAECIHR